jgi:hypothetical protein
MGAACPLTTIEGRLRAMSGEASQSHDFIGYRVDRLIFYNFPSWVFTVAYVVFGILVTIVFVLAPPRLPAVAYRRCPGAVIELKDPYARSPLSESAMPRGEHREDAAASLRIHLQIHAVVILFCLKARIRLRDRGLSRLIEGDEVVVRGQATRARLGGTRSTSGGRASSASCWKPV